MSDEAKLKQFLTKYKHPDVTKREVLNVIQQHKSLSFKFESFIFNDGSCVELVNMEGTVPVLFKGSSYNIPVCIWLMDTHPTNAPLCFVKPTSDMAIKVSKCVDYNGRIYLPYLHEWKSGNSNLLKLIRIMCQTFSETPPVYAKPRGAGNKQPPYPTASFMPQPGGAAPTNYTPYPAMPYPGASSTPYPPAGNLPYPAYGGGGGYNAYNNPYPYPNAQPSNTPYGGYPNVQPASDNTSGGTITEEHIQASLRSAVEDKLRRRLREHFSQNQAELETLRRTQQELTDGKQKLDDIMSRLGREECELDKNIGILEEKEGELERSISKLTDQDGVDPDEAVMTTAPLYNQLLNAFAEEATTEDAIYYMGEALRTDVVDLDSFLKQVRALSRKQFTLRALMQKCRQKAGLAY